MPAAHELPPEHRNLAVSLVPAAGSATLPVDLRVPPLGPSICSQVQAPSQNVVNLQQRVSGVLPVRIDIPRTGQSFSFVRPLVLDEETVLRFQYKAQ